MRNILASLSVLVLSVVVSNASADSKAPVAPKAPAAEAKPATGPKCRAMDGTKQIAEASGASTSDCSFELRESVKKHFCTKGSKGKTFKFTVDFDHKLGARKWPTAKDSMFCSAEVQ